MGRRCATTGAEKAVGAHRSLPWQDQCHARTRPLCADEEMQPRLAVGGDGNDGGGDVDAEMQLL